jgi:SAM-dependent methyltransferase
MKPLEEIYKGQFFGRRNKLAWRVPIVCSAVENALGLVPGNSIVDVGCAIGDFVDGFYERGYKARGIEGSLNAKPFLVDRVKDKIVFHDLRYPVSFNGSKIIDRRFDAAICLEVAEHIEEEYAAQLVANLCFLSNVVLVSAAPPGQGGHYHVNCQPPEYWVNLFYERGYQRQTSREFRWKGYLFQYSRMKGINAYYANTLIFRRYK